MVSLIWRGRNCISAFSFGQVWFKVSFLPQCTWLQPKHWTLDYLPLPQHTRKWKTTFLELRKTVFAQRGRGVSLTVDIPGPSGHSPVLWDKILAGQGGGTSDPLQSLPALPTLWFNFEVCEQHFTTQKSHFQSCQAHTPHMSSQMILVPALLKSQAPGKGASPSEKRARYHQNRYPLMARVKPCTYQHLGVTKITLNWGNLA